MNYITDSKQINLSSSSANISNGSKNSNLLFQLPAILKYDKHILYNQISVIHAEIPISFYIINSTNNKLYINATLYTLTIGNYNATTFKNMLLSLLPAGYSLYLNSTTGVFTLSYTSNFTINSNSTCYKILGLAKNTSYSSTSNTLIFPYPCNFLGVNRLKIKSNILLTNNIDTNSNGRNNLLTTIPVNSAQYGLIIYENKVNFKCIFPNTPLDYIDIQITDEDDNELDFNNVPVYITIQIDSIREQLPDNSNLTSIMSSEVNQKDYIEM
jgi:hypothetical protein